MIEARFLGRSSHAVTEELIRTLISQRKRDLAPDTCLIYEHEPVFTFRKWERDRHAIRDLETFEEYSKTHAIPRLQMKRGGGMMYHGPGQLIVTPIIKLRPGFDIIQYRNCLEETMIHVFREFWGIETFRIRFDVQKRIWRTEHEEPLSLFENEPRNGAQGIWAGRSQTPKKIGFLGAHYDLRTRTIAYGCAMNLCPDLTPFSLIDPCNLPGIEVTSVEKLSGNSPEITSILARQVAAIFCEHIGEPFRWIE